MKKTVVLAALTLMSASAFAGVTLSTRIDYLNTPKFSNDANADSGATSYFTPSYIRLNFGSKVGEASVTGTLNLMGDSAPGAGAWNAFSVIDNLTITKGFGDMWVSVGRLINPAGGYDAVIKNDGNNYLPVLANGGAIAGFSAATAGQITAITTPTNLPGAALGYKMGDHTVRFDVTDESNFIAGTSVKKRNNLGLSYDGSFADKMVGVKAGYLAGAADTYATYTNGVGSGAITQNNQTFMNLGANVNVSDWTILAEYFSNSQKANQDGAKANSITSMYAAAMYKMGAYTPLVKIENSELKMQEDATVLGSFKRSSVAVGVEIVPKAGDDFRYHIVYASVSDKLGNTTVTNGTVNWSQLIAGIKFGADFMK
jgi:hypothetical protein